VSADLQAFVREALARGIPRPAIVTALREAGWRGEEIEAALAAWAEVEFPLPVPRRQPYLSAREAFLYLVLFATLYTTAFNVGVVLFRLIERLLPDPKQRWETARQIADAARGATAALVIAFPVYLALARVIGRGIQREPEKRGSKVRKWLTYVTLFAAAMVLIGDLTVLVSFLLSGELATRVVLKVTVVFAIAGTVFGHYLGELRRDEGEGAAPARELRVPPRLAAAVVAIVIVAGLLAAGSPRHERQRALDAIRIEDLRAIAREVESYGAQNHALPAALSDVMNRPEAMGGRSFRDPVTRRLYEYQVLDSLRYRLCATFATQDSAADVADGPAVSEFWRHPAGRHCFTVALRRIELGTADGRFPRTY
jgi:hypothetical protein